LEKDDIVLSYSHPYVRISKKVISPLGESKDEIWVMKKLAEKLNLKEEWIFEDPWKALERAFKNTLTNGSFKDLAEGATLKLKYRPLNEYQTPTKKIEFYSKKAEELGLSPLPKQYLLKLKEDEFILLNSSTLKYTHTQFQEVYGPIPPIVYINPDDAKFFGVENNEVIELYNELGRTRIRAKVSADVPKRVLWSPKQFVGLCGRPQNILVPCLTQEIGGGPIFNSTIVRIKKLNI
jgi:anaerobic selenocysteine-containing dehydrogenase